MLAMAINASGDPLLEGMDVSHFDGTIDWNQAAASGRSFAFAMASDGLAQDSTFATNYAGIQSAGLIRGAFQIFEPGQDPVAQANLLLADIGTLTPGDLPPVLDVEVTGNKSPTALAGEIQSWVSTVENATGETPIILTTQTFWNSSVTNANFSADPLWLGATGVSVPTKFPLGWNNWQFWLYSVSGSVPGVGGSVDLDRFNGTLTDLDSLAHQPTETVPDSAGTLGLLASAVAGLIALRCWRPKARSGA